jgi:probable phosphoenolpyruvate synthase
MKEKVSVEEFKKFKEKVDNFITKEADTFYFRNLMESIHDPSYMKEVNRIIDYVNGKRTAEEIEKLFQMLRSKGESQFVIRDKATTHDDILNYSLRGLAYFCLVEALNENSSFSERIVSDIKKKYGDKYLDIISKIDKANLSVDGSKILTPEDVDLPNDEEMKKYLVMKRWQDKQRTYSMKRIRPMYPKELEYIGEPEPNLIRLHKKTLVKRATEDMEKEGIVPIEEIAKYYEAGLEPELLKIVGGKALGLAKLKANGVNIPETYVIPVKNSMKDYDFSQILDTSKKYAVRSSADVEDGGKFSFAGMFDSYLDTSINDITKRVEDVKESVNNARVKKYIEMNGLNRPSMSVIVQEFREPEYSGVWIGKDKSSGTLEWVKGSGEKLVSGKENPTREVWQEEKADIATTIEAEDKVGLQLLKIQNQLAGESEDVADMEWCILDGKLVLLQYRPVTKEVKLNKNTTLDNIKQNDAIFKGSPASAGEVLGKAEFYRNLSDIKQWHDGDILMAWFTDPDWMEIMSKSSGLITAVGGLLCHSAIIARELGIPCVTGIGSKAMKTIWGEKEMYLNGTTGEVCTAKVYKSTKKNKEVSGSC